VEALIGGEQAVNDLVAGMEIHQSGVSRHLRILEKAGVVPRNLNARTARRGSGVV